MPSTDDPSAPRPRRRLRRVALATLALGAAIVAGLWVAPSVLTPLIARRLSAFTGADVRVGWITWNPLAGRAVLHHLAVAAEARAAPVLTVQALTVDVALRRWLHGERALDAIVLRRPWVALRRTGPGDFNVASLFPALAATTGAADSAGTDVGPPIPLRIGLFRIVSGSIEFHDETTTPALETSLHLDDASARDLILASDGSAGLAFHVESRLENAPLTLDVSYDTATDASHLVARLVTTDASLARALLYVPLGWQRTSGTMNATITYDRRTENGVLRAHTLKADLGLHDLALAEPWADEPMLTAKRVRLPLLTVDLLKQRTDLGAVQVDDYRVIVLRDGERMRVPLASGSTDTASSTWQTVLDRVALGKGTAVLRNVLAAPEVTVALTSGAIQLPPDAVTFTFAGTLAGGHIILDGRSHGDTTTLSFRLDDLDLASAAPLVASPVAFAKGRIDGTVDLTLAPPRATFAGALTARDTTSAPAASHPEEVFAWQRLEVAIADSPLDPLLVHLTSADVTWPYVMVHRRADGVFPFTAGIASSSPAPGPSPAAEDGPSWLQIDRLRIDGGRIELYDTTLPVAYGIDLTDLAASADGVALGPTRAEELTLTGALDELSPVDVRGRVAAAGATLKVTIDRLLLPPLNPYLAPALGYEVKTGLARVASDVRLAGTVVAADTDLVLSRFAMRAAGTDTLEARIGTPLSVALALMKDTRGDIHLHLPIEGDVASSEYRVGSLLREALGTALLGTLRAPLGFLRGIFRKDEGERFDLRPVPFPAGSADLGPDGEVRISDLVRLLERQAALRALLIPAPSRADFDAAVSAGMPRPLDTLAELARRRGEIVSARLTQVHGIDPKRVAVEPWKPVEPDIEGEPGVDVQLRTD